jgi:hypothetical protein
MAKCLRDVCLLCWRRGGAPGGLASLAGRGVAAIFRLLLLLARVHTLARATAGGYLGTVGPQCHLASREANILQCPEGGAWVAARQGP